MKAVMELGVCKKLGEHDYPRNNRAYWYSDEKKTPKEIKPLKENRGVGCRRYIIKYEKQKIKTNNLFRFSTALQSH